MNNAPSIQHTTVHTLTTLQYVSNTTPIAHPHIPPHPTPHPLTPHTETTHTRAMPDQRQYQTETLNTHCTQDGPEQTEKSMGPRREECALSAHSSVGTYIGNLALVVGSESTSGNTIGRFWDWSLWRVVFLQECWMRGGCRHYGRSL